MNKSKNLCTFFLIEKEEIIIILDLIENVLKIRNYIYKDKS